MGPCELVRIGIAEGDVITGGNQISTTGLGSCVGLVIYDLRLDIAGMVHIMLPESPQKPVVHPAKYADTAIQWLVDRLVEMGADMRRLGAKYAGGAQMFRSIKVESLRIGDRNVEAVQQCLQKLQIPVIGRDVGGDFGRTIRFSLPSRELFIRTARGIETSI